MEGLFSEFYGIPIQATSPESLGESKQKQIEQG